MRRFFCTLVLLVAFSLCNAQLIQISGQVTSVLEGTPVSDVQIFSAENQFLGSTKADGKFKIALYKDQTITFTHVLYVSLNYAVTESKSEISILLEPKELLLPDVHVNAKLPEIVYSDENFHVADYQFSTEGIYILTYTKSRMFRKESNAGKTILSHCQVILLDEELKVKSKSMFFNDGVSLHLDSYGQLFLKCLTEVHFIYEENDELLSLEMDQDEFSKTIEPLIYGDDDLKIYSNFDKTFPEFSYYVQVDDATEAQTIYTVTDSVLMHTFRAQYRNLGPRDKLNAYRTELKTGIDKEIISGYMAGFHHHILFHAPYAPIFKRDSGFLIIDATNSIIQYFDDQCLLESSSPFLLNKKPKRSGWQNLIIQDLATEKLYVVYEKNGIGELELLLDGENHSEMKTQLFYKYPQKIKVKDGYVYYLYRPFESSQKHYLYKEKIKSSASL